MAIAIVAIPAKDDYVWRLSSEKIPHLTLCFLGDNLNNQSHVEDFLAHAVDTSLSQFGMDVDHRGVLGPDSADVLFFGNFSRDMLQQFRANLLTDIDIFTAYNSVVQYPEWIPHLTLGWPTDPAKPDNRDFPGTTWVNFDKIALWTGNFEGVEFPLKKNDLSMSEKGAEFFKHFGVKGMHWGVRKQAAAGAGFLKEAHLPSQDAKDAARAQTKAKLGGVRTMSNAEMRRVINRMELEQRYRDLYGEHQLHDEAVSKAKRWSKRGARWAAKFAEDVGKDAAASWLRRPGSGSSAKQDPIRVQAWTTGNQFAGAIGASPRAIGS